MSTVNFGIIGSNFIVDTFFEGAAHVSRFKAVAMYSRTRERGEEFAAKHSIPKVYTDLEAMAADPEIDAVYVASPNALHCRQSLLFLNHGKHVLCEKAFASNAREVRLMIRAARANNVMLMEAVRTTQVPNYLQVKHNLHKLGKIRRYFAQYCQYSSRYDKYKEGIVLNAFKRELSNGSLMDIGIYCLYPLVALFGKPESICANGVLLDTGVDGEGSIVARYPDMEAVMMFSKISNSALPSEIQGEDGNMQIMAINNFDKVKIIYRDKHEEELSVPYNPDDIYYELSAFIDGIEAGRIEDTINTHAVSLAVMELMDEARSQMGVVFPADE